MNDKPLGMRIGESVFCAAYLLFAAVAGVIFLAHGRGAVAADFASTCGAMTLLLCSGDAFHLVPRILGNIRGTGKDAVERRRHQFLLGLGNLVSSITMTLFYVLLFDAMALHPDHTGTQAPATVRTLLVVLAVVRIALCLLPQNRWFDGSGSREWGIYRNIPFVAMGLLTVVYLVVWHHAWLLALLVVASFACYMGVVLYAREKPMLGMLMIPKTCCYVAIIGLLLAAL